MHCFEPVLPFVFQEMLQLFFAVVTLILLVRNAFHYLGLPLESIQVRLLSFLHFTFKRKLGITGQELGKLTGENAAVTLILLVRNAFHYLGLPLESIQVRLLSFLHFTLKRKLGITGQELGKL
jgi:hypothetical protein